MISIFRHDCGADKTSYYGLTKAKEFQQPGSRDMGIFVESRPPHSLPPRILAFSPINLSGNFQSKKSTGAADTAPAHGNPPPCQPAASRAALHCGQQRCSQGTLFPSNSITELHRLALLESLPHQQQSQHRFFCSKGQSGRGHRGNRGDAEYEAGLSTAEGGAGYGTDSVVMLGQACFFLFAAGEDSGCDPSAGESLGDADWASEDVWDPGRVWFAFLADSVASWQWTMRGSTCPQGSV